MVKERRTPSEILQVAMELLPATATCEKCGRPRRKGCDGTGWIEGKDYSDGSFSTARPCPGDNPHYETH